MVCCNGRSCVQEYERCCNNTCCNRYSGTCQQGTLKAGSSRNNYVEVTIPYDICTTVEQIDIIRAWWMFVLPSFLLIGTLVCLALALVFANRVDRTARRGLEKGIIFTAIIAIGFSTTTFFAPIYKYGTVIVFVSIFAIITAAARKIRMYVVCIIFQFIAIWYLIDPFHGNDYLTLAVDRTLASHADPRAAGLWHATTRIWDFPDTCWDFYANYFRFDPMIRDITRFDEPNNPSFGYCSRGWVSALLVFDGVIIVAIVVQILLSIITLLIRGRMLVSVTETVAWNTY